MTIPARPWLAAALLLLTTPVFAQDVKAPDPDGPAGPDLELSAEAKAHFRSSDENRFPSPFFPPAAGVFQETVSPGEHFEVSTLTLFADLTWGENLAGHAKVDIVDLYDRNPTSEDRQVDADEVWLRFGRETEPAIVPERPGLYLKVGKMPKFERQDDRHLESYGLVSTAFNRFEDAGVELGIDLGRHFYLKATATQGNPVFLRDPNALAGDNGTPGRVALPVGNDLGSGFPIFYDAEIEGLDVDGELETGAGLGFRLGDETGDRGLDVMVWGYQRTLAQTVKLEGTIYGGDLDLLDGPSGQEGSPSLHGDDKQEVGANLWLYLRGLTVFAQYVDQELAGLPRVGYEGEVAWSFELPLRWAVGGSQLFPFLQPAVRYSKIDNDFVNRGGGPGRSFPAPSVQWDWEKFDLGFRLGIVDGIDLTVEYAANRMTTARGEIDNDELLTTLRWSM
jgi:hypothetical protein